MHAYLVVGEDKKALKAKAEEISRKLKAKLLEFPLTKIEDARALNSFISLSLAQTTLIVCDIENSTHEAMNAFLKNLEEPQENLYFALTSPSAHKVIPTILSRCQLLKVKGQKVEQKEQIQKFLKMSIGGKLSEVDKIKERETAISFVWDVVFELHNLIHIQQKGLKGLAENIKISTLTLERLRANGNVSLQLANMAISLV